MTEDIKELNEIIDELRQINIAGSNGDLLALAIQIQRNRILKAALFETHPDGRGGFFYLSNLEKIAEIN